MRPVSSKGQIAIPAELRQQDGIEAGQEFDIERLESGEYLMQRRSMPVNEGAIQCLLDCPAKDWFVSIESEHEGDIAIDPIILGEVRFGMLLLPKGRRRERLERWFDSGILRIHCVPFDATVGLTWSALMATLRASGRAMMCSCGSTARGRSALSAQRPPSSRRRPPG